MEKILCFKNMSLQFYGKIIFNYKALAIFLSF